MNLFNRNQEKKIYLLIPVFVLTVIIGIYLVKSAAFAAGAGNSVPDKDSAGGRKVAVLIIDYLSLDDLQKPGLVNFRKVIGAGGFGLMNTRTASYTKADRAGGMLSMGMGTRVKIEDPDKVLSLAQKSEQAGGEGNSGQEPVLSSLINKNNNRLVAYLREKYPNQLPGKIGEEARRQGKKIALVGNADTDKHRPEAFLMAMDFSGRVPAGYIGPELLVKDPSFPWGFKTDSGKLLTYTLRALAGSDIVFIDFGDTVRVQEAAKALNLSESRLEKFKEEALRNADRFLGSFLQATGNDNLVLMIVSPLAPENTVSGVNKYLAPFIIYEQGKGPGVLTSRTTRHHGLVSNADLGPTIFAELGVDSSQLHFLGEAVETVPDSDNFNTVAGNLSGYINAKKARYATHALFIALLICTLLFLYLPLLKGTRAYVRLSRTLAVMTLAFPAAAFIIPSVPVRMHYALIAGLVFLAALLPGLLFSGNERRAFAAMAWSAVATSVYILTNLLLDTDLWLKTPFGFNDVFMGGRYYGINNDSMGILLGSTVFGAFYLYDRMKLGRPARILLSLAVFALLVLSLTPLYGANVGGTIAAMSTGVVCLIALISGVPVKKSRVVLTVVLVFALELGIAYVDYLSGGLSHAGKVMGALINQGFGPKFTEVLKSKLQLFGIMLILPPWNILLGGQIYLYYAVSKRFAGLLQKMREQRAVFAASVDVIFYGGLVALVFNDTGVIATALMLIYLTVPLGFILNNQSRA